MMFVLAIVSLLLIHVQSSSAHYVAPFASSGTLAISKKQPEFPDNGVPKLDNNCNENSTVCSGRLWIYYSSAKLTSRWGTINRHGFNSAARDIACRQLGYTKHAEVHHEPPPLNDPQNFTIWLTDFSKCGEAEADGKNYNNLLQCRPTLCSIDICDPATEHHEDIFVDCLNEKQSPNYYEGEIFLAPPDEKPYGMQTSFGVIQRYFKGDIKGITAAKASDVANYFYGARRDTVCKQMGYTGAVTDSVYTIAALTMEDKFHFSASVNNSLFNVDKLENCEIASTSCFECCYKDPHAYCPTSECNPEQDSLVISCTYDSHMDNPHNQYDAGNKEKCTYGKVQCPTGTTLDGSIIAIYVVSIALSVAVVVVLSLCMCCKRCRRKGQYQQVEENNNRN